MRTRCCPECFGDRGLTKNIIPFRSPEKGNCNFCDSRDVELVEPGQLFTEFEMLASVYEPSEQGKSLVEWLKEDWQLFSHPRMDVAHAKELLCEILDDGEIVRQNFVPSPAYRSEGLARWETLRDELLYKNRYFLDEALDKSRLQDLLEHLLADPVPDIWYRARIMNANVPFTLAEMGAPPKQLAANGRANPVGIPYLYLGSLPDTAVAEIRPHTGESACVATFQLNQPVAIVDLRDPRRFVSPFVLSDANAIGQLRADIPFLERLGNELTRPVLPRSAAIDYIPSQYLCEFIKKNGYDGVIFRSSVSAGINLALFDPEIGSGVDVAEYSVNRVSVEVARV